VTTAAGAFRVGGMAKGAGMIEPHMATMLGFVTTDAAVAAPVLQRALREAVDVTFNAITIDGDTFHQRHRVLARQRRVGRRDRRGGLSRIRRCTPGGLRLTRPRHRSRGEGVTKLVSISATGAASAADARPRPGRLQIHVAGEDRAPWRRPELGRLLAAAGRAGVAFDVEHASVRVGPVVLFQDGVRSTIEPRAAVYLAARNSPSEIDLGAGGTHSAAVWTCDLSAEYGGESMRTIAHRQKQEARRAH